MKGMRRLATAMLAMSGTLSATGAEPAEAAALHPLLEEHKAAVEEYAKCMDKYLREDDDRTVEDGRKECDAELGRMKATVAAPEWERALELIEDAIPEIKERREGK